MKRLEEIEKEHANPVVAARMKRQKALRDWSKFLDRNPGGHHGTKWLETWVSKRVLALPLSGGSVLHSLPGVRRGDVAYCISAAG